MPSEGACPLPGRQRDPLPVEIYERILSFGLGAPELARLMRASSQLYHLACPLLYAKLDLDLARAHHPLSYSRPLAAIPDPLCNVLPEGSPSDPLSLLSTLPDRFSYTTHLTLTAHDHTSCAGVAYPKLPKLRTLRIRPDDPDDDCPCCRTPPALSACRCRHALSANGKRCPGTPACSCPLLAGLRPSLLILGDANSGFPDPYSGLWTTTAGRIPEFVCEIAIIIGHDPSNSESTTRQTQWLELVPTTVERLTLVMSTWDLSSGEEDEGGFAEEVTSGTWRYAENRPPKVLRGLSLVFLRLDLARALTGSAAAQVVVALESMLPDWSDTEVQAEMAEVRLQVVRCLRGKGWSYETAEKRAQAIEFVPGDEYLQGLDNGEKEDRRFRAFREAIRAAVMDSR